MRLPSDHICYVPSTPVVLCLRGTLPLVMLSWYVFDFRGDRNKDELANRCALSRKGGGQTCANKNYSQNGTTCPTARSSIKDIGGGLRVDSSLPGVASCEAHSSNLGS